MSTKKRALSQTELREIYVREGWFLGRSISKLREWLDSQKVASQPDLPSWHNALNVTSLLSAIAQEVLNRGWGVVLRDVAEPMKSWDQACKEYVEALPTYLQWFAKRLDPTTSIFSIAEHDRMAYVNGLNETDSADEVMVVHLDPDDDEAVLAYASELDLLDAALNSWNKGNDRAERARKLCCDWMRTALGGVESMAGKAFDEAVAVSTDGRRILNVDYVVVYRYHPRHKLTAHCYRSTSFHEHKICLVAPHVVKVPMPNKKRTDHELFLLAMKNLAKKAVAEGLKLKKRQIFIQIGLVKILLIDKDSIPDGLKDKLASTAPAPAEMELPESGTIVSPPPDMEHDLRRPAPPPPTHSPTLPSAVNSLPPVLDRLPPNGGLPSI
jgi:hypothetical protein